MALNICGICDSGDSRQGRANEGTSDSESGISVAEILVSAFPLGEEQTAGLLRNRALFFFLSFSKWNSCFSAIAEETEHFVLAGPWAPALVAAVEKAAHTVRRRGGRPGTLTSARRSRDPLETPAVTRAPTGPGRGTVRGDTRTGGAKKRIGQAFFPRRAAERWDARARHGWFPEPCWLGQEGPGGQSGWRRQGPRGVDPCPPPLGQHRRGHSCLPEGTPAVALPTAAAAERGDGEERSYDGFIDLSDVPWGWQEG